LINFSRNQDIKENLKILMKKEPLVGLLVNPRVYLSYCILYGKGGHEILATGTKFPNLYRTLLKNAVLFVEKLRRSSPYR